MPTGPGSLDAQGIWQYGEDDNEALASDLLNLGQESVSTQLALERATARGLRQIVPFTSSGNFVKATYPWLRAILVQCQAGGGGGGGAAATAAGQWAAASGGTGGGYAESLITDIAGLASSVFVSVGTGGTAGAAGGNGGNGVNSSFGTAVVALGGLGGLLGTARTPAWPADSRGADTQAAPTGGTGDFIIPGGQADTTLYAAFGSFAVGSKGGRSVMGGPGFPPATGAAVAGIGYGGGGSGSTNVPSSAAKVGAAGSQGIVRLWLFA